MYHVSGGSRFFPWFSSLFSYLMVSIVIIHLLFIFRKRIKNLFLLLFLFFRLQIIDKTFFIFFTMIHFFHIIYNFSLFLWLHPYLYTKNEFYNYLLYQKH